MTGKRMVVTIMAVGILAIGSQIYAQTAMPPMTKDDAAKAGDQMKSDMNATTGAAKGTAEGAKKETKAKAKSAKHQKKAAAKSAKAKEREMKHGAKQEGAAATGAAKDAVKDATMP